MFEDAGFKQVKSVVVPGFRFRKPSTQHEAELFGVKAVLFTGVKPEAKPAT